MDPGHPRLDARYLGREELCLILPADEPEEAVRFEALEARGFVAHPDGYAYADDLFALNFPDAFTGSDRLRLRTYVNQIGQIPEPVAQGIGYTLLPKSGIEAFAGRDRLRIAPLPHRRHHELWLVSRRGRPLSARHARVARLAEGVARELD